MSTVDVYKNTRKLGSGSMTNGGTTVTGFTAVTGEPQPAVGKRIRLVATSSTDIGKSFMAVITANPGAGTITFAAYGGGANPLAT